MNAIRSNRVAGIISVLVILGVAAWLWYNFAGPPAPGGGPTSPEQAMDTPTGDAAPSANPTSPDPSADTPTSE